MADPDMMHCKCGFTCGTKAAMKKHLNKFDALGQGQDHGVDPEPFSPLRKTRTQLLIDACQSESPSLSGDSFASTVPTSPITPLTPNLPLYTPLAPITPSSAQHGVRLLLVRHAQSANKCRTPGQKPVADPELSTLGFEQAQALGRRLYSEFAGGHKGRVLMVSSPMRRCLLTVQPAVQLLKLPLDNCMCHGAFYEYGCAGRAYRGSTPADIVQEFPEFKPIGFNAQGKWDYSGNSDKENEPECKARCLRIVQWLLKEADAAREAALRDGGAARTLIVSTHQTVADLLCHLLVSGRADRWSYGEITYKLQNACMTEMFLYPNGRAALGVQNDSAHLMSIRFRLNIY
mmetsp:Transcript_122931/g.342564  ORF Transcript_122931/g.342564 Transcript_122931/m.342564 type:complete len:346 (-) Transcript_122931:51-1088(-)